MNKPTLILTSLTIAAATLLTSCGKKTRASLEEVVPADAVALAWIEDVPSYRNLYPKAVFEGALVLQKVSLAKSAGTEQLEQLTAISEASNILLSIVEQLSGEFVASVTPVGGFETEPAIQILADYEGDLATLEEALSKINGIGPVVEGETYDEYTFKSRTITSKMNLHYALSDGFLVSGTDLASVKNSINVLNGTPLPKDITSNPKFQRALSLSDGYDGGLIFGQITDEFREFLNSDLKKTNQNALIGKNISGFDGIDAAFIGYPKGKEALRSSKIGLLFHEKIGLINLIQKPASSIELPTWADSDAYLNWTTQSDPIHFKDQILSIVEMFQPGASRNYQQINQQATMFIGVSIDELFSDVLGDQVTVSLKMDEAALAAAMTPQAGPTQPPLQEIILEIALKDVATFEGILEKIVAQTGGALQSEKIGNATLLSSPMPIPNLKAGSKLSLGISDNSFFLSVTDSDKLRSILSGEDTENSGAFQSPVVERAIKDSKDSAFTVLKANYKSFGAFFESFAKTDDLELSDQEKESLEAYIDFILSYLDELVLVGTEEEDAFVFRIGMGK